MDLEEFRSEAHRLVDWMADYLEGIRDYPVKPGVRPGEILGALPEEPPEKGEPFPAIFSDFRETILPGITHWQHPSFFAYFPANSSPPSVLAEMLTATLGAQCMSWLTSPAATELEERVMGWLGKMIGLPGKYTGVIQDTASTSTLVSLITAREKATGFGVNERGFETGERFTIYGSTETHSSIEKAVKIAGFGRESFRKVGVDENFALLPEELEKAVRADLEAGFRPLAVSGPEALVRDPKLRGGRDPGDPEEARRDRPLPGGGDPGEGGFRDPGAPHFKPALLPVPPARRGRPGEARRPQREISPGRERDGQGLPLPHQAPRRLYDPHGDRPDPDHPGGRPGGLGSDIQACRNALRSGDGRPCEGVPGDQDGQAGPCRPAPAGKHQLLQSVPQVDLRQGQGGEGGDPDQPLFLSPGHLFLGGPRRRGAPGGGPGLPGGADPMISRTFDAPF